MDIILHATEFETFKFLLLSLWFYFQNFLKFLPLHRKKSVNTINF